MLLALWLVHRPPNSTVRMLALRLLHALAGTPAAAWAAAAHAGCLYLLSVLLPTPAASATDQVGCARFQKVACGIERRGKACTCL